VIQVLCALGYASRAIAVIQRPQEGRLLFAARVYLFFLPPISNLWVYYLDMSATPATQRAWIVERRGRPADALKFRSDWEVPTKLKQGEVLLKIQAAALNPV
jgi:hypothetical protein